MIKPEQIPDEVCLGLLHALLGNPQPTPQTVRAAIAAALNAWPKRKMLYAKGIFPAELILPLQKEGE